MGTCPHPPREGPERGAEFFSNYSPVDGPCGPTPTLPPLSQREGTEGQIPLDAWEWDRIHTSSGRC